MATGKTAKTPPITRQTKILCFDLEANGLHGPVFAVGAVLMDGESKIYEQFTARCPIKGKVDSWVEDNVLPVISDMDETHRSEKELREAFWSWYMKNEPKSDYVLVANGYPVEYRFLIQCQEENLDERYWQHPFPILDLTSLIIGAGETGAKVAAEIVKSRGKNRHNPYDDAMVTAKVAFQVLLH